MAHFSKSAFAVAWLLAEAAVASAAEAPSFDCAGAKSAREISTCRHPELARADRAMAAAWRAARGRTRGYAEELLADQRKALEDIDGGFEATLWFKGNVPDDGPLAAALAEAEKSNPRAIAGLAREIDRRSRLLSSLRADRSGFAGLWAGHDVMVEVSKRDGRWSVRYAVESYGWPKYRCHFTGTATAVGPTLLLEVERNQDFDEDRAARIVLRREGPLLIVEEKTPTDPATEPQHVCGHRPGIADRLFPIAEGSLSFAPIE